MKLLTPKQTSEFYGGQIGLREKTLANWRCKGIGPRFIKIGRLVFYELDELIRFAKSREFQSTWAAKEKSNAA